MIACLLYPNYAQSLPICWHYAQCFSMPKLCSSIIGTGLLVMHKGLSGFQAAITTEICTVHRLIKYYSTMHDTSNWLTRLSRVIICSQVDYYGSQACLVYKDHLCQLHLIQRPILGNHQNRTYICFFITVCHLILENQ